MFATKLTLGRSRRAAICRGSALAESTLTARPMQYNLPHEPNMVHGHDSLVQEHLTLGQEFRSSDRGQGGRSMCSHRGSLQTVEVLLQAVAGTVPANRLPRPHRHYRHGNGRQVVDLL